MNQFARRKASAKGRRRGTALRLFFDLETLHDQLIQAFNFITGKADWQAKLKHTAL